MPLATEVFDGVLGSAPNQRDRRVDEAALGGEVPGDPAALLDLRVDGASVTEAGARLNVSVALQYLDAGCAATALPRSTTSWRTPRPPRSRARSCGSGASPRRPLDDGRPLTADRYRAIRDEELAALGGAGTGRLGEAAELLDGLVLDDSFVEFLTLPAYDRLR